MSTRRASRCAPLYLADPFDVRRIDLKNTLENAGDALLGTALLIIDMQRCMASPAAGRRNNPDAEANIGRLLATWRTAALPVVHIRHLSRSPTSAFWPGQDGAAFQAAFLPAAGEHVADKNVPDAFANSGLEHWLHVRGIRKLVIVGVSTNHSVESTARSAGNLGFETVVVADACFAFDMTDYTGVHRVASEIHAMSLANLAGEYARIASSDEVLLAFAKSSAETG